jgi:hypothetical protein
MPQHGTVGPAHFEITTESGGAKTVRVWRDYERGVPPCTAQRVWEIVADFGGLKKIFPTLVRVYLTYPDATDTSLLTVRDITFAGDPLAFGVEQLVELNEQARRLTYISVLGLPVKGYRSVMEVTGDDACRLTWTSTFRPDPGQEGIADVLAKILAGGANQIATVLGLDGG